MTLTKGRFGNCGEEARLAELIGNINGQENITTGRIIVNDGISKKNYDTKHRVAIISKEPLKDNVYSFKNKDVVIIDPWLGITDFAGNYFTKLKTIFRGDVKNIPDTTNFMKVLKLLSKSFDDFKSKRKECSRVKFKIVTTQEKSLTEEKVKELKQQFPELVIEKYEPIKL